MADKEVAGDAVVGKVAVGKHSIYISSGTAAGSQWAIEALFKSYGLEPHVGKAKAGDPLVALLGEGPILRFRPMPRKRDQQYAQLLDPNKVKEAFAPHHGKDVTFAQLWEAVTACKADISKEPRR